MTTTSHTPSRTSWIASTLCAMGVRSCTAMTNPPYHPVIDLKSMGFDIPPLQWVIHIKSKLSKSVDHKPVSEAIRVSKALPWGSLRHMSEYSRHMGTKSITKITCSLHRKVASKPQPFVHSCTTRVSYPTRFGYGQMRQSSPNRVRETTRSVPTRYAYRVGHADTCPANKYNWG